MTNQDAYDRAMAALKNAHDLTESFDGGGLASHEIMNAVRHALALEFKVSDQGAARKYFS